MSKHCCLFYRYKDGNEVTAASTGGSSQQSDPQSHHSAHMDYLGPVNPVLPPFGEIEASDVKLLEGLTENDLSDFTAVYREHCEVRLQGHIHALIVLYEFYIIIGCYGRNC